MSITSKRRLKTNADVENLIGYLLPDFVKKDVRNQVALANAGNHPLRQIISELWANGACKPMSWARLFKILPRPEIIEFDEKDKCDKKPGARAIKERKDRRVAARKRLERVNDDLRAPECKWLARVAYHVKHKEYRLLVDQKDVAAFDSRGTNPKEIDICFNGQRSKGNKVVLCPGDPLRFTLDIPMKGYLHLFHVDGKDKLDQLYPQEGVKHEPVERSRLGRPCRFPEDLFAKGVEFKIDAIGRQKVLQKVLAVVTSQLASVTPKDLQSRGYLSQSRGISMEVPSFKDLAGRDTAIGEMSYYLDQTNGR